MGLSLCAQRAFPDTSPVGQFVRLQVKQDTGEAGVGAM